MRQVHRPQSIFCSSDPVTRQFGHDAVPRGHTCRKALGLQRTGCRQPKSSCNAIKLDSTGRPEKKKKKKKKKKQCL